MLVNRTLKCILTMIWCLCICVTAKAQQENPMFYSEIHLKHKPYTLQSLTEEIQAQSGISFSYNADKISPNTPVKIKAEQLTVAALLAVVKRNTNIGYKIISQNHIVYTDPAKDLKSAKRPRKKGKKNSARSVASRSHGDSEPSTFSIKTYSIAKTSVIVDDVNDANVVIVGDSSMVSSYYLSGGYAGAGIVGGNNGGSNRKVADIDEDEPEEDLSDEGSWRNDMPVHSVGGSKMLKKEDVIDFFKSHVVFSAGLSADETYYCAPTLRVGLSFLYGTMSYNVGSISTWRFGLGSSIKINDQWRMHFNYNTGPYVSKNYVVQFFDTIPPVDSGAGPTVNETDKPLLVSSRLTRYSMGFDWNMGKGFSLEGALIFNSMKTNYSSSGNPVNLSDFLPFGIDADSKYYAIKPPYTLGNSYSAGNSSNTKTWLGFQISIFYSLKFLER